MARHGRGGTARPASERPAFRATLPAIVSLVDRLARSSQFAHFQRPLLERLAALTEERKVPGDSFVLRQGVWTDTGYAEGQPTRRVAFGSDGYFALLAERPELAPYLALGNRVIVVLDGQAYEVGTE